MARVPRLVPIVDWSADIILSDEFYKTLLAAPVPVLENER